MPRPAAEARTVFRKPGTHGALVLAGVLGAFLLGPRLFSFAILPPCLLKSVTGVPCPGCGSTRAVKALFALDVPAALAWNPLVALAAILGGLGLVALSVRSLFGVPFPPFPNDLPLWMKLLLALLVAANWAYLLAAGR
ncbi:MAG: DUF2752 domain-containing protein [Acidobacteria bacterium]|nr:DUF2752 domain-containing protein [Acidobacteriota bacterium]